jgi:hypothetical protein
MRLRAANPVIVGLDPAIGYPHQFANDAIPANNHPMAMAASSPAMTALAARAVRQQQGHSSTNVASPVLHEDPQGDEQEARQHQYGCQGDDAGLERPGPVDQHAHHVRAHETAKSTDTVD